MQGKQNKDFFNLFLRRELVPLSGRKLSNLMIMVAILFIAFTVIGFAEGSLRYLELKMKDPFINWVNVVPKAHQGVPVSRVIQELNTDQVKKEYFLLSAMAYNRFQLNFYDFEDIQQYYQKGEINTEKIFGFAARTMDYDDPVMKEVFSPKNIYRGNAAEDKMDIGLIVTADFLTRLNYPSSTPFVWMDFLAYRTGDASDMRVPIPVPVNAVVRALPGMSFFVGSSYFYQQRSLEFGRSPFNPSHDGRLVLAWQGDQEKIAELENTVEQLFETVDRAGLYQADRVWSETRYGVGDEPGYLVYVNFKPGNVPLDLLDQMFMALYNHTDFTPYRKDTYRMYDYATRFTAQRAAHAYDRISLNFSNLDMLREFSVMLQEKYGLEVDMAQIESRENYNFVSRLTGIISLVLIAFSILSVVLFMSYLLKRHLEGIKRNLGTFKAFGLSNSFLMDIYVKIVLFILAVATLIALLLASLFGYSGGMRWILLAVGSRFEAGNYFSLFSSHLLIAIVLLAAFSIWVLRAISRRILNHSPGDLIYERE